jgi:hypothetical protein
MLIRGRVAGFRCPSRMTRRTGPDFCVPYSLESRDGRMKAVFGTSFKARQTSAMIDLERVRGASPESAQAPSRP